jgi:phosphate starvation-inducible protein PhoH
MDDKIIEFEKYYGKPKYTIKKPNVKLQARSINQRDYIDLLLNPYNTIVFAMGPAGTGKTMLACLAALKAYSENKIDKIVLTRPAVMNSTAFYRAHYNKRWSHGQDQSLMCLKSTTR